MKSKKNQSKLILEKNGLKKSGTFIHPDLPLGWSSSRFKFNPDPYDVFTSILDCDLDEEYVADFIPLAVPELEPTVASIYYDDAKPGKPVFLFYEGNPYKINKKLDDFFKMIQPT